ncbi:hypothetical protein [Bradyrhizobium sp. ARR65]|uniref:hypothetical protein n=1 Tax=Bradyrhizobium sp. ARR65 TaxID=1040989 RepID=UPI000A523946|nr:hypothetical protein [Bradyrhizobium sp. ARR65]
MKFDTAIVTLANTDQDFGHVPAKAERTAQGLANTSGKPVSLRHPVTDKVLDTVKPGSKAKARV